MRGNGRNAGGTDKANDEAGIEIKRYFMVDMLLRRNWNCWPILNCWSSLKLLE